MQFLLKSVCMQAEHCMQNVVLGFSRGRLSVDDPKELLQTIVFLIHGSHTPLLSKLQLVTFSFHSHARFAANLMFSFLEPQKER